MAGVPRPDRLPSVGPERPAARLYTSRRGLETLETGKSVPPYFSTCRQEKKTGYEDPSWVVPADVLDGYPADLAAALPDLIGTRLPHIKKVAALGQQIFLTYFPRSPWMCEFCGDP